MRERDENRDPLTGEPGAHPLGVAGGGTGGALAGAAIGGAVGGPLGAAVGGAIGAVAGGYAGKGAAEVINPTEEAGYWREQYRTRPYYESGREFEYYEPAYRYGWESAARPNYAGRRFEDIEPELGRTWDAYRGRSRAHWPEIRSATRDAYERVHARTAAGVTRAGEERQSRSR